MIFKGPSDRGNVQQNTHNTIVLDTPVVTILTLHTIVLDTPI